MFGLLFLSTAGDAMAGAGFDVDFTLDKATGFQAESFALPAGCDRAGVDESEAAAVVLFDAALADDGAPPGSFRTLF